MKPRPWSDHDLQILKNFYGKPGYDVKWLAEKLGRSVEGVRQIAYLRGLTQKRKSYKRTCRPGRKPKAAIHTPAIKPVKVQAPTPQVQLHQEPVFVPMPMLQPLHQQEEEIVTRQDIIDNHYRIDDYWMFASDGGRLMGPPFQV